MEYDYAWEKMRVEWSAPRFDFGHAELDCNEKEFFFNSSTDDSQKVFCYNIRTVYFSESQKDWNEAEESEMKEIDELELSSLQRYLITSI